MPKLVPEEISVNEYEPFTIGFSIECEAEEESCEIPTITSVSISGNSLPNNINEGFRTQIMGGSVIITGVLADVFEREMHYIMPGNTLHVARTWSQIPENFETIVKYKGAMQREKSVNVVVNTSSGTFSSTIKVINNFNVANRYLANYIKKGKY